MALGGGSTASDIQVEIAGNSSSLRSAISDAVSSLGDMRNAALIAGGALATLASQGIRSSVNAAGEFEAAMANVEKVTDSETVAQLGESIRELSTRIPLAHEELAALATQAGRMGAEGAEEIEAFTEVAASMGAATVL